MAGGNSFSSNVTYRVQGLRGKKILYIGCEILTYPDGSKDVSVGYWLLPINHLLSLLLTTIAYCLSLLLLVVKH